MRLGHFGIPTSRVSIFKLGRVYALHPLATAEISCYVIASCILILISTYSTRAARGRNYRQIHTTPAISLAEVKSLKRVCQD